jgi:hypothetical protein
MLNDNFASQVGRHLTEIYTKAAEIRLDKQLDLTNNIYKTIITKISRVYSFGVQREFTDDNTAMLYEDMQINKIMKEANFFCNAFNDILIQVGWNYKENKPRLIFRYPHKTEVVLDEYDQPKEVEYFVESINETKEKWAFWSESEHYYKIYDGEEYRIEYPADNEEGVNPYGVLPFIFIQNGFRDGKFFDEYTGQDLVSITLDNAVYSTFKNYLLKWQSFKQLIVTGDNIGAFSGQILDPSTALTASGTDVKVDILDLQSDLSQLDTTIQNAANNVAINYNISPSQFRMTGQVSSGFALKMENKALDEFTLEQQHDFKRYEQELFNMLALVIEKESGTNIGEMTVRINEPTYDESPSAEIDTYTKKIDLGLTSVTEAIAMERGITKEEATVILDENLTERNKVYEKVNRGTQLDFASTANQLGL